MTTLRSYLYSQVTPECDGILYTILRGDSLYLLAREYNVTIDDILNANPGLDPFNLQIGTQICIPFSR
ncbi:MAG: LysM peptidoglycan-binding domain-containing protein [Clostridiales bacterium]|nr:LysM peptidoglycan-binding domain-containing protein [Clostridiales bacterium]